MPEIQWKYYAGRGPEVNEILARMQQAWSSVQAARRSLMDEYGANGLMPGDRKRYTVTALLYYEKPPYNFMQCTLSSSKTPDGREYYIARPSLRHQEGRLLAEKLASPAVTFDQSNELINLLGVNCMADFKASANQTSSSMVWSSAERVEDVVLVRMPADVSKQHILGRAPKIPRFLKLVKKEIYEAALAGDFSGLRQPPAR